MAHRLSTALGAFLLCTCAAASAQVYKCPDTSGSTVIQQHPCVGGTKVDVRPASGSDDAVGPQGGVAHGGSNQAILAAIARREPAVGMSELNLRMAMGSPLRINRANYSGRSSDQWVYQRPDATWYVYVENGLVRSFQSQQAITSRTAPGTRCPSSLEIRNLETSANSVTLTPEERRVKKRLVADAKACR